MSKNITAAELSEASPGDVLQIYPSLGDAELYLSRGPDGRWWTVDPTRREGMWSISDEELLSHLLWWTNEPKAEPEFVLYTHHEMSEALEPVDSLAWEAAEDIAEKLDYHRSRLTYHQQRIRFWEGAS